MKLTKDQIQLINESLISKDVIYEDVKLELIDHIASEIELEQESTFEEAFAKSLKKWESLLKQTKSFGWGIIGPKIIVDRYVAAASKIFKSSLFSTLFFSILMTTITIMYPQEQVYTILKSFLSSVYILSCTVILTIMFFVWKLKSKTVYGFFFLKSSCLLPFNFYMIYTLLNGNYRHYQRGSLFSNFMEWSITSFFFFISVYLIALAAEHFRIVKKYKLI